MLDQFRDLTLFPDELLGISEILVLAPPAFPKERTRRFKAVFRWRKHLNKIRFREVLMVSEDTDPDVFARQGEWNHDDPQGLFAGFLILGRVTRQSRAQVRQGHDFDIEFLVIRKGLGVEGSFPGHRSSEKAQARCQVHAWILAVLLAACPSNVRSWVPKRSPVSKTPGLSSW